MEKIYTIPVNEAFETSGSCPFCRMKQQLEDREVDLILGASMMEPDVRIKTNEKGFCARHFKKMFAAQKRLPLGLILESHLDQVKKEIAPPALSLKDKTASVAEKAEKQACSCYVCDRVEFHWGKMFETACLLWESDPAFRKKTEAQRYFCLPCYARFLKTAKLMLNKKTLPDFLKAADGVESGYLASLKDDVSFFCRKFDYRYADEPWGNARDAVERALRFLTGEDTVENKEPKRES
ncbi:MAG: hypothetical protein J6Z79_02385 [Clostridia bacterium]|nr:hypothetical protein [Clostridia bacterium]